MSWDPDRYEEYLDERLRPGLELANRVQGSMARIVDLGCGTGRLTLRLAERWPDAEVVGVDHDPAMLATARSRPGAARVRWVEADLRTWGPPASPDLVYSNAALHWIDDHPRLMARLAGMLSPGGTLAVQMPRNHDRPTHTAIATAAADPRWADRLVPLLRPRPVAEPVEYLRMLGDLGLRPSVWETDALHVLEGPDPVLTWVEGSVLRPLLAALSPTQAEALRADLARRYRQAYPPEPDGTTVLAFRRVFMVARAASVPPS